MKLQKVEKLDKNVISSFKIYKRPFTSVIQFECPRFEKFKKLQDFSPIPATTGGGEITPSPRPNSLKYLKNNLSY